MKYHLKTSDTFYYYNNNNDIDTLVAAVQKTVDDAKECASGLIDPDFNVLYPGIIRVSGWRPMTPEEREVYDKRAASRAKAAEKRKETIRQKEIVKLKELLKKHPSVSLSENEGEPL